MTLKSIVCQNSIQYRIHLQDATLNCVSIVAAPPTFKSLTFYLTPTKYIHSPEVLNDS